MKDLLLKIVRDDFSISEPFRMAELSIEDWESLFELSRRLKISPLFCEAVREHMPQAAKGLYTENIRKQSYFCDANEIALKKIDKACTDESLRFVLFKGMASSLSIYGDARVRQAGDIDILVASEDLFRFNYAVRKAGVFQPDISIGVKARYRQLSRLLQYRSGLSAPYPKRRSSSSDQLIPYYFAGLPCRVEVHDGYESLPAPFISEMLWSIAKLRVGEVEVRVPDIDHLFVLLLVTAHSNSYGYYSAVDGEFNLRDYVDIRHLLKKQPPSLNMGEVQKIIKKYDLEKLAAETLSLYRQIYDEDRLPSLGFDSISGTPPSHSHMNRLFDPALCAESAVAEVRMSCSTGQVGRNDGTSPRFVRTGEWLACRNRFDLDINCSVEPTETDMLVRWKIPAAVVSDLDLFAFKISFIPSVDVPYLELSIGYFSLADGTGQSCWYKSNRLAPRFTPERSEGRIPTKVSHGAATSTVTAIAPLSTLDISPSDYLKGIGLIPSVYLRDSPNSFCDINDRVEYAEIQYVLS